MHRALPIALMATLGAAYALADMECPAAAKAWMPTGEEMATACPFEPRFKDAIHEMGSARGCHYDFSAQAGSAGIDVSKAGGSSAEAAAQAAVAAFPASQGYAGEARKMAWADLEAYHFVVNRKGQPMLGGYYVGTRKGVFKVEFWTSDRTKADGCAEKVIGNVVKRIGG